MIDISILNFSNDAFLPNHRQNPSSEPYFIMLPANELAMDKSRKKSFDNELK